MTTGMIEIGLIIVSLNNIITYLGRLCCNMQSSVLQPAFDVKISSCIKNDSKHLNVSNTCSQVDGSIKFMIWGIKLSSSVDQSLGNVYVSTKSSTVERSVAICILGSKWFTVFFRIGMVDHKKTLGWEQLYQLEIRNHNRTWRLRSLLLKIYFSVNLQIPKFLLRSTLILSLLSSVTEKKINHFDSSVESCFMQ